MGIFQKLSPEEKAERERVNRNVAGKTFGTAVLVAVLIYIVKAANDQPGWGIFDGFVAFFGTGFVSLIFFSFYEKDQSRKRLAYMAERRLADQRQAEQAARDSEARKAQQKRDDLIVESARQAEALKEQKRRDDREYLLRKLANTNTFIDLYDPAKLDLVPRIKQGISTDLNDILRKHSRADLAEVMKREPDVRGMVVSLGEHLHAKGIRSAEASQILAALT